MEYPGDTADFEYHRVSANALSPSYRNSSYDPEYSCESGIASMEYANV